MNNELIENNIKQIRLNFDLIRREFDYQILHKKLQELKNKSSSPDIWNNKNAKSIFQEMKILENKINEYERIKVLLNHLKNFILFL